MTGELNSEPVRATWASDVESWLSTLHQIGESKTYKAPDFLRPFHLLTFALFLKAGKYSGVRFPEYLENYAIRMNIYEAAGIPPPKSINKFDSRGRFEPVTPLVDSQSIGAMATRLSAVCAAQGVAPETLHSLEASITELLENCYAHAKTGGHDFHGLAAAQLWPYGNLGQIAIADAGVGIRSRLMDNPKLHRLLGRENACELATRYGVTADEATHAGYGLTLAKDLLSPNGGSLMVVSKNELVVCDANGVHPGNLKTGWNGTLIIFEWNTQNKLDASAVYKRWPAPRGYDDDDFI
jgi:anti-sigma regulatory factor (Ser/Thr protein kinase)